LHQASLAFLALKGLRGKRKDEGKKPKTSKCNELIKMEIYRQVETCERPISSSLGHYRGWQAGGRVRGLDLACEGQASITAASALCITWGIIKFFLLHTFVVCSHCQVACCGISTSQAVHLSPGVQWSELWDQEAFLAAAPLTGALDIYSVPRRLAPQ
jgi:hypothetical protein